MHLCDLLLLYAFPTLGCQVLWVYSLDTWNLYFMAPANNNLTFWTFLQPLLFSLWYNCSWGLELTEVNSRNEQRTWNIAGQILIKRLVSHNARHCHRELWGSSYYRLYSVIIGGRKGLRHSLWELGIFLCLWGPPEEHNSYFRNFVFPFFLHFPWILPLWFCKLNRVRLAAFLKLVYFLLRPLGSSQY